MENYLQKVDSDYGFSVAKKLISFRNTEKGFRLAEPGRKMRLRTGLRKK